jgi:hypothetical protein
LLGGGVAPGCCREELIGIRTRDPGPSAFFISRFLFIFLN